MPSRRSEGRADRILDAAGDLLMRLGYRKVTVDDIARASGVGKGTVYLHWRTKEELFEALLRREYVELISELLERLAADPGLAQPHRFSRMSFVATCRRPLLLAVSTGDREIIGAMAKGPLHAQDTVAADQYFDCLLRHGLLRDDVPGLAETLHHTSYGFFLPDPSGAPTDVEARADGLAHVVRHAFEPPRKPRQSALVAAAAELRALFGALLDAYQKAIYPDGG
ncbi:TetR/AcrR family transcriptional regulator [Amycolatopsis suaedae]|uniref:TetR/AcrR family transcriptional regulator n=1 Tax=Amycolatopsis suaedae TaxID=2510978 RepID=A0A4V2EL44_9PSEU|nr:TetR/AcrR family transcriptional regulator [Amycolatopsis suaedae]RZQ60275.1 TetR/AcrR family transcriptional regulator [Amycolatopsis suaedae]